MDEPLDITDAGSADVSVADGSVDFENVSFSYAKKGDNLTLENINLHIRSGETIGIIGGTGSAKTTLVQLIPRLYDVYSGSLKVGGRDVREYPLETLRNAVAMVLQKNVLFSGTIKGKTCAGETLARPTNRLKRLAVRHRRMILSAFSPMGTTRIWDRAASTYPAGRNSGCVLHVRC